MYRKMEETIHGNCASIQPPFSAYMTQLTGNTSAPIERAFNFGLKTILGLYIYFVLVST
jgi:hypothetical protein